MAKFFNVGDKEDVYDKRIMIIKIINSNQVTSTNKKYDFESIIYKFRICIREMIIL